MHTLFALSSVLLVLLGGYLVLGVVQHLTDWARRRDLQLVVLATPVVSLGLGLCGLYHFADQLCFLNAPTWDATVSLALPLVMGVIARGGLLLGVVRLGLMYWTVTRWGLPVRAELQLLANRLAQHLGAPSPRVLLCRYHRPLALTCGLWRPTVLLSTWLTEHLDQHELEAVLAHELGHVRRRDYLVIWLATMLRDAFWYLPTSWTAYRQLQYEKEVACDDLAVGLTQRPLALASALARVWHQACAGPAFGLAQPLTETSVSIEERITRLLTPAQPARCNLEAWAALSIVAAAVTGLLVLELVNFAVMMVLMDCGSMTPWSILR